VNYLLRLGTSAASKVWRESKRFFSRLGVKRSRIE
jgi:hypothetical protein